MDHLDTFPFSSLNKVSGGDQKRALASLESGKIIFLPNLSFSISEEEKTFFSPHIVSLKSKNVSYSVHTDKLGGIKPEFMNHSGLRSLLKRYALESKKILGALYPSYIPHIRQGRTSFRPVETEGRSISRRKDDTLLHVDAFPANPVKGERILRVFTNVNPFQRPRIWNVGEPFEKVVEKMAPKIAAPFPLSSILLKLFKITKSTRSLYDHYMLKMHDSMKEDSLYQDSVEKKEIAFPAQSTWIVFTDQVSHAALSGQFLFEQTFYLPPKAQEDENKAPLRVLERFLNKKLL